MNTKVINYIESTVSNDSFKAFLIDLISSVEINHKLLCLCILIEIKNDILDKDIYLSIINNIESNNLKVNYDTFTNHINLIFSQESRGQTKLSTIVSLPIFESSIGSFRNNSLEIDEEKIADSGWPTINDVIWVTPHDEFEQIIEQTIEVPFPANDVCDHAGIARTKSLASTRNPRRTHLEFVSVNYSDKFNEPVYQSNHSNVNWKNPAIMFISYPKFDGFGRTYNENGIPFAKEQFHKKFFYCDPGFQVRYIGGMSIKACNRLGILEEAFRRLNI